MPLMLVAGDHAINDMASDEEDSWKTQLQEAGIEAQPWLQGLGENPQIRAMFVHHLQRALEKSSAEVMA
jgi:sirohydrochlorin cobaltochelatase